MRVFIDPGHGGSDPGAIGPTGVRESAVALAVGLRVAKLCVAWAQPVLSRHENVPLSLQQRAALANDAGADLFVSVHANAFTTPAAHGTETYHFPGSANGRALAQAIHPRLVAATGRRDRGIKTARFAVLRLTRMPAVLLELAFITNPEEEALLADTQWQDTVAAAIDAGLREVGGVANE